MPFHDWEIAGCVRAQLYRLREKLRFREFCHDYDCLTFRLVEGDLCIILRAEVPSVDDAIQAVEPAQMPGGIIAGAFIEKHRAGRTDTGKD